MNEAYSGKTISAMRDQTRMAMCVFMFAVLAFNPFGSLIGSGNSFDGIEGLGASRTLKGVDVGRLILQSILDISKQ